jgi:hypothetical protein
VDGGGRGISVRSTFEISLTVIWAGTTARLFGKTVCVWTWVMVAIALITTAEYDGIQGREHEEESGLF